MFYLIAKAATDASSSAENGFVSCSGIDCNVCELVKTVVNIFQWLVWVSAAVAILFIVIGGFIYIGARGNENWMSQAKRTIIWAVVGFAIVLLAFLAIKVTYQVLGATNQGLWEEIDCSTSGASNTTNKTKIPQQNLANLIRGGRNGGVIAGRVGKNTSAGDFQQLISSLPQDEVLIFATLDQNNKKPIMAIGKNQDQPELLFVDKTLINELLKSSKTSSIVNIAKAESIMSASDIETLLSELTQIINKLIENNQELLAIIAKKTKLDPANPLGN